MWKSSVLLHGKIQRLYLCMCKGMCTYLMPLEKLINFLKCAGYITYHLYFVLAGLGNNVLLVLEKRKNGRIFVSKRTALI